MHCIISNYSLQKVLNVTSKNAELAIRSSYKLVFLIFFFSFLLHNTTSPNGVRTLEQKYIISTIWNRLESSSYSHLCFVQLQYTEVNFMENLHKSPNSINAITLTNQSTFKYTLSKVQSHYDGQQYSQASTKALIQERNID